MTMIDWDDEYANGKYIKDSDTYPAKWDHLASVFRRLLVERLRAELDISYGSNPREVLDLFLPDAAPKGLMVFVHGGYWKTFDKNSWSHLAAGALSKGFAVAMPSYPLCPEVGIADITRSIMKAIDAAAGRIAGPIHLCGHSAGGHLVCRMLCNDLVWQSCFPARIAQVVSISGVHDLRPLLKTAMNDIFGLDEDAADLESPLLNSDFKPVPVTAWVGAKERPVFIDQSRLLSEQWPGATLHIEPDKHHFDVIDDLADANSRLIQTLLG